MAPTESCKSIVINAMCSCTCNLISQHYFTPKHRLRLLLYTDVLRSFPHSKSPGSVPSIKINRFEQVHESRTMHIYVHVSLIFMHEDICICMQYMLLSC